MCGIWDWQSTIVKDLNDSQDPKNTLFCRENAFVAIYALFSDKKCPLFTRFGGGRPKRTVSAFLTVFLMMASLTFSLRCSLFLLVARAGLFNFCFFLKRKKFLLIFYPTSNVSKRFKTQKKRISSDILTSE